MPDIPKKAAGFTFIELLVAISIFSAVAVSIYSAFNAGVLAWRKLVVATEGCQQTRIALDLMADEITNYIPSKKVKLEAAADKIAFLGRINDVDAQGGLGKISFFLDGSTNTLIRSQKGLKAIINETGQAAAAAESQDVSTEEFLGNASSLEFKYYCKKAGSEENEYEWVDSLDSGAGYVCKAVGISITLLRKGDLYLRAEDSEIKFTKTAVLFVENEIAQPSS